MLSSSYNNGFATNTVLRFRPKSHAAMSKQMVTCVLLWSFVLLRIAVPVVGDLNSGTRCTVQDSERKRNFIACISAV